MDRLWSVGLALGLLASVGCQQSGTADYRELSEHDLIEHSAGDQKVSSTEDSAAEPISVPMAEDAAVDPVEQPAPVASGQTSDPAVQPASAVAVVTPVEVPVDPPAEAAPEENGVNGGPADAAGSPADGTATPATPGKIELLIPEKTFQPEGKEQALRVSFDDIDLLKVLNMEPVPLDAVNHFPGWLSGLDGQKVVLRGWMFPPLEQEGLTGFLFVRDNQICCFGRNPKVYDKVIVDLREGETTKYIQGRPFDVIGTFSIQAEESDGELLILYFIEDAIVIDK